MISRRNPFEVMRRDMEDIRAELDTMFQVVSSGNRFLPAGGMGGQMLPAIRAGFRVDVREHDTEVIITADLPGVNKESAALRLINRDSLRSTAHADRKPGKTPKTGISVNTGPVT